MDRNSKKSKNSKISNQKQDFLEITQKKKFTKDQEQIQSLKAQLEKLALENSQLKSFSLPNKSNSSNNMLNECKFGKKCWFREKCFNDHDESDYEFWTNNPRKRKNEINTS